MTVVLVDTTVWIDFFGGARAAHVATLERFLREGEDLCVCGVILAEVLQGIREDADFARVSSRFDDCIFLPMERETYVAAARLYRSLRRRGVTIRQPVDCMIAAVAIEHDVPLLHHDRDFDALAAHGGLKVVKVA